MRKHIVIFGGSMKKYKRIGISLGGGGGKGAYQIGVLKAIHEYGLDKGIVAIAGTSIGSLNIATYVTDLEQGERLWDSLDRKEILTRNKKIRLKNFGIYSREGMEKVINANVDLRKLSKLKKPRMYVTATRAKDNEEVTFLLNGKEPEFIMSCLKASSAIPGVFERTEIDGDLYMDGGLKENLPLEVLVEDEKCDLIFAIPLAGMHEPKDDTFPDTTIINFKSRNYDKIAVWSGVLGFTGVLARKRIAEGHKVGRDMIHHLMEIGVLNVHRKAPMGVKKRAKAYAKKKEKEELKKYYVVGDIPAYKKEYASTKLSLANRVGSRAIKRIFKRKENKIDLKE